MKNKVNNMLIYIFSIIFVIGYFSGFSILSNYITKFVIYISLLIIWIILMRNIIHKSIKTYKKEYFNECLSIVIVILIVSCLLNLIFSKLGLTSNLENTNSIQDIIFMIFPSLIFAPIVEELFSRSVINSITKKFTTNSIIINLVSSIIFSFMYLYKMKLNIFGYINYGLIYVILGYTCSYYYEKNNNILSACIIHFLWNLFMISGTVIRIIF